MSLNELLERKRTDPPLELFMRTENVKIANKLDDFWKSENISFMLQGPPGVGKTKETLLWILNKLAKNQGLVAAWIRLEKISPAGGGPAPMVVFILEQDREDPAGVHFERIDEVTIDDLRSVLTEYVCKVVVFDNVNEQNKNPMLHIRAGKEQKVIVACSLQLKHDASLSNEVSYTANGWTLSEYLDACTNNEFYESVKSNLRTDEFTEEDMNDLNDTDMRTDIVTAKHHIAGGSARWMFQFSADDLLDPAGVDANCIEHHLARASLEQIIAGFRQDRSITEVNHMMTRIDGKPTIVSQYMANCMTQKHGEALVRSARHLLGDSNPAMDGILMEMEFILRLGRSTAVKEETVDLIMEANTDPRPVFASGRTVVRFRLKTFVDQLLALCDGDWMVPSVFNNGGFDCVQYLGTVLIFVQITRSATHSFKLKWYQKFCDAFTAKFPSITISSTEVHFVVQEELVGTFKPKAAEGTLANFNKDEFKVVGMRRMKV